MELRFLGTGSAFCMENYQSNGLLWQDGSYMLIDVGTDIRFSLKNSNVKLSEIDAIYVSHAHADHIGGLEFLAFATFFTPGRPKIKLYVHESWADELWNESLKGGLKGIEGKKMTLADYFEVILVHDNEPFYWKGIEFYTVQTLHNYAQYKQIDSYGLMITYNETEKLYFTTDCQFAAETAQRHSIKKQQ